MAKGIFVTTESGWFSDRTAFYLASGKPAVVQDTGFGRSIPVGRGLLAFNTLDEAISGVEEIASDYDGHCRAARALAEEHFGSDRVINTFLDDVGLALSSNSPFPFVVGSGRSGTTLLRAMLDAHSELAIPGESHFLTEMIENRRRYEMDGLRCGALRCGPARE